MLVGEGAGVIKKKNLTAFFQVLNASLEVH